MAKVDPGRLPASCSQEVGSTHDGPGTGAGSPGDQYWSQIPYGGCWPFPGGGVPQGPQARRTRTPHRSVSRDQGASGQARQGGPPGPPWPPLAPAGPPPAPPGPPWPPLTPLAPGLSWPPRPVSPPTPWAAPLGPPAPPPLNPPGTPGFGASLTGPLWAPLPGPWAAQTDPGLGPWSFVTE